VADAADGLPAHLTMLYPFVEPGRLGPHIRAALAEVAARHRPFDYILAGAAQWPDTVYVAVDPISPFVALQANLARAFPDFPIYGRDAGFGFVPHVTIAEGRSVDDPATLADRGWRALPRPVRASSLDAIAQGELGRWRTVWRIPLGSRARDAVGAATRR
jgi:2'-5' RNA ligase